MQQSSIIKNNQGVDFMVSRDFEAALRSFQESLAWSKKSELPVVVKQQQGLSIEHQAPQRGTKDQRASMASAFQIECVYNPSTLDASQYEETNDLRALLSPFRVKEELPPLYQLSCGTPPSQRERTSCNLSMAVTILNAAISCHQLFLMGDTTTAWKEETRRSKAITLYHRVVEIVRSANLHEDSDTKHLEAVMDLIVIIALNNSLVLSRDDDNFYEEVLGHYDEEGGTTTTSTTKLMQKTQHLLQEIVWCSSKEYSCCARKAGVTRLLSKYQEECLINVLVLRVLKPKSAAAA